MSKVRLKKGVAHYGTNKYSGSNSLETLEGALAEQAKCHACGCDPDQGFITLPDLDTADGDLFLVFVHGGALQIIADSVANRDNFAACCRERAAGGDTPSCDALVA